jgi:hypothetical protein
MTLSRRSTTALIVALGISLMVNLIGIGFTATVLGDVIVGGLVLRQKIGPVPAELRRNFRAELFAQRRPVLSALVDLRRDRDRLHDLLTAESLDQQEISAANAEIRRDVEALLALGQDILGKAVANLPLEVRREIPRLNLGNQLLQSLTGEDQTGLGELFSPDA